MNVILLKYKYCIGIINSILFKVENTGLRLNGKDDNGITPIHYAAVHNRHDVVSWLLEKEIGLLKDRLIVESKPLDSPSESSKVINNYINLYIQCRSKLCIRCETFEIYSHFFGMTYIFKEFLNTFNKIVSVETFDD